MKSFQNKTAVITGAAEGIGRATVFRMAALGANIVAVDTNQEKLNELKEKLTEYGAEYLLCECDVSDEAKVNEVVSEAIERFGKIDILVNNAGIWRDFRMFAESTSDIWKRYIDVNILGVMYFTRAVIGDMLEKKYGKIINVGSVAGVYGNAGMAAYSMTKGAVIAFTKALAKEVADQGVLVNCVSPGSVSGQFDEAEPSELSFLGRSGTHTENANLICFLASDEASYIAGQNYQIDGCRKKL